MYICIYMYIYMYINTLASLINIHVHVHMYIVCYIGDYYHGTRLDAAYYTCLRQLCLYIQNTKLDSYSVVLCKSVYINICHCGVNRCNRLHLALSHAILSYSTLAGGAFQHSTLKSWKLPEDEARLYHCNKSICCWIYE